MVAFSLAKKNIIRKQERSLLTIIGVILAVGSFVALLSIAEGLSQKIANELKSRNVDIYVLPSGSSSLPTGPVGVIGSSSDDIDVYRPLPDVEKAKEAKGDKPRKRHDNIISFLNPSDSRDSRVPNIKSAIGVARFQKTIKGRNVIFWGLPFTSNDFDGKSLFSSYMNGMKIENGMFPTESNGIDDLYGCSTERGPSDLTDNEAVLIAGKSIANELKMQTEKPITFKKDGLKLRLEGIVSFPAEFQNYFCYVPIQTAMAINGTHGKVSEIWIQVEDKGKIRETIKFLRKYMPELDFKTRDEYLGSSAEMLRYAWLLEFAIALIGILIATTASMNTMLMSTFERIREFGALRATGANRSTIASMIMTESMILSTIGGVAGIIVGLVGSIFLDGAVQVVFRTTLPMASITPGLILYALLLSVFIGVTGAIFPIIIVYRMEIIKALKWDI